MHPAAHERRYRRLLEAYVRRVHLAAMKHLRPVLREHRGEILALSRQDDQLMLSAFDFGLAAAMREAAQVQFAFGELPGIGLGVDRFGARSLAQIMGQPIVDTQARTALLEQWAIQNAALVKDLGPRHVAQLAQTISKGLETGARPDALAKLLQARLGVTESRARLIARDQTASLNSRLAEQQQTSVGVTEYVWVTSADERVRPEHAELNGTTMRWDSPHPTEGHPGDAINCRCFARPVMPATRPPRSP